MGKVVVICPVTQAPAVTISADVDRDSIKQGALFSDFVNTRVQCRQCGAMHIYNAPDLQYVDDE